MIVRCIDFCENKRGFSVSGHVTVTGSGLRSEMLFLRGIQGRAKIVCFLESVITCNI